MIKKAKENACGSVSAAILERIIYNKPFERTLTEENIDILRIAHTLQIMLNLAI